MGGVFSKKKGGFPPSQGRGDFFGFSAKGVFLQIYFPFWKGVQTLGFFRGKVNFGIDPLRGVKGQIFFHQGGHVPRGRGMFSNRGDWQDGTFQPLGLNWLTRAG